MKKGHKLKPCPFCEGTAEIYTTVFGVKVQCIKCGAKSDWAVVIAAARKRWNRRPKE